MMNFISRSCQDYNKDEKNKTQIMIIPSSVSTADLSLGLSSFPDEVVVGVVLQKEHMFNKVVTPSDVGKLNRLVIPKLYAEKFFPLDSSMGEKGLLLNFEDSTGKPWRFRYSYWNSSQSYVMTKGWSRFVKEKNLAAGDIVSFLRGLGGEIGKDRLFIEWRRRQESAAPSDNHHRIPPSCPGYFFHHHQAWNNKTSGPSMDHQAVYWQENLTSYQHHHHQFHQSLLGYGGRRSGPHRFFSDQTQAEFHTRNRHDLMSVYDSVPVVIKRREEKKRFRLFGVNMDCPLPESGRDGDHQE